jgi:hypothetical protein
LRASAFRASRARTSSPDVIPFLRRPGILPILRLPLATTGAGYVETSVRHVSVPGALGARGTGKRPRRRRARQLRRAQSARRLRVSRQEMGRNSRRHGPAFATRQSPAHLRLHGRGERPARSACRRARRGRRGLLHRRAQSPNTELELRLVESKLEQVVRKLQRVLPIPGSPSSVSSCSRPSNMPSKAARNRRSSAARPTNVGSVCVTASRMTRSAIS